MCATHRLTGTPPERIIDLPKDAAARATVYCSVRLTYEGIVSLLTIDAFQREFDGHTQDWSWEIKGFLDGNDYVHPIDTDTKVLSTVFERLVAPVIRSIAGAHGYLVEIANQTTYPDFTLSLYDKKKQLLHRIAIDIKTTYRSRNMLFTLGGYASFLRNGTKNILYPYQSYNEHWVIGFIYSQAERFREYDLDNLPKPDEIHCPYTDVVVILRQKHEISGLRPGSGNTKNIGSIKLKDAELFKTAIGPFGHFTDGKAASDHYWANFENYKDSIAIDSDLHAHDDFQEFGPKK